MRPLRLLHFDLKGLTNYGDTVLFDAVRQLFNGFGGGVFEMHETRSLHELVTEPLVDRINDEFDAVVVGGGGLFLRDTNPNRNSGWQWNMPIDMLRRLRKPIIVFAVGYNRFPQQADFDDIFGEHLALCIEKSCFFGLRNHGSIRAIEQYVPKELHERIEFQPCPTTMTSYLLPDVVAAGAQQRSADAHLGVQLMVDRRMVAGGYDFERFFDRHARVLRRLQADDWRFDTIAHMANERDVALELKRRGVDTNTVNLFESADSVERGIEFYSSVPITYGARGHATMIPFGTGAIPLAVVVHDKVGFFLEDIGHPEFGLDPDADDFEDRAYATITNALANRTTLGEELAQRREEFFNLTMSNLATIYQRLTGEIVEPSLRPYTPLERKLAHQAFVAGVDAQSARAWANKQAARVKQLERRIAELEGWS